MKSDIQISIGNLIKDARLSKGMSQIELAELAQISQPSIVRYETGERLPPFAIIALISGALGIDYEKLAGPARRQLKEKFDIEISKSYAP